MMNIEALTTTKLDIDNGLGRHRIKSKDRDVAGTQGLLPSFVGGESGVWASVIRERPIS